MTIHPEEEWRKSDDTRTLFRVKISLHWLQDFVQFTENDARRIAERLTVSSAEVERTEELGELLHHCCVGTITAIKKHPKADRLSLCEVATDRGIKRVVCGGSNLRTGMFVAFAHIGAYVRWHGKDLATLEKVTIRGEESEGMICAAEELDLTRLFPKQLAGEICDLGQVSGVPPSPRLRRVGRCQVSVGTDLRKALDLTDTIFHIDNHAITHRPDLFSHIGFARECVAIGIAQWKKKPKDTSIAFSKTPFPFTIHNDCRALVPRYNACLLSIDSLGVTPDWMRQRLEATGWRSVNLPVDITNYVTMELGMPLHSFDTQDLHGTIHIRKTSERENVQTLDGLKRPLPMGVVVLSDEKGIFDLLGIMGGERSSMKDTTRTVLLHAATVRPSVIRQAILATGLRTDAATIYEKGVPPCFVPEGFSRALSLFLTIVPGARITSKLLSFGKDGTAKRISLSLDHASNTIGIDLPKKKAVSILQNLGCTVQNTKRHLVVTPPLYRQDLREEHDLIEELARVYGYDLLLASLPSALCLPPRRDPRLHQIRIQAKEEGFLEVLPLSLVGPLLLRRSGFSETLCVPVENTLGEELSLLQPSALPRLLEHAEKAFPLVASPLRTFTLAHVFKKPHEEFHVLAMLLVQKSPATLRASPSLLLKTALTALFKRAGYFPLFSPQSSPLSPAHPAQCAGIFAGEIPVGELFTIRPDICSAFGLPFAAAASVNLDLLFALPPPPRTFRPLPTLPSVSYDITIPRKSSSVPLQHILEKARKASSLLRNLSVTDLFDGNPLSQGEYTVTIRCMYRADDRTLTDKETKKEHEKVTRALYSE